MRALSDVRAASCTPCTEEHLVDTELTWWEGVRIVTPAKAIIQGIDSGVSTALLHQALHQGRARGQITASEGNHLDEKLESRSR